MGRCEAYYGTPQQYSSGTTPQMGLFQSLLELNGVLPLLGSVSGNIPVQPDHVLGT